MTNIRTRHIPAEMCEIIIKGQNKWNKKAPKPPSDISGLTWAEYTNNGLEFLPDHPRKLASIIEFAIRKKRSF